MSAPVDARTNTSALSDAEERKQALDLSAHVLVTAPAGSGKTGLLVHRLLRALATVDEPEQVVAITFTTKAAAEIRARVLEALHAAHEPSDSPHERALRASACAVLSRDAQRKWQLLAQPARLNALTIDSFCAQIAAQLPVLSGLGGSLAPNEDSRSLFEPAILRLFESLEDADLPDADREALACLLRLHGNRIDRLIDPLCELLARRETWIQAAANADEDHSGIDRAALRALIEPALQAFERALDAGTREELIDLLRDGGGEHELLRWAEWIQAWPAAEVANLALLRQLAATLVTKGGTLRKRIDARDGFAPKTAHKARLMALLEAHEGDVALEDAASAVCTLPDAELHEDLIALRHAWLRVLRLLNAILRVSFAEQRQIDFAQLVISAREALSDERGYSEALLVSDRRIRHLLVDEMQDTSEGQIGLLHQLTREWTPGDGRSLFLVGDPQQSIYAFRKAEVRLFMGLREKARLGELPLRLLGISTNFRSQPEVVGWFNNTFDVIFPRESDLLRGRVPFHKSEAQRTSIGEGGVRVAVFASAEEEADALAQEALQHLSAGRSVVVLARVKRLLEPVIRALRMRQHTPACQDLDPLAALPEVRDVLALARALWHPQDRLNWAVLLRAPFVGLSWAQLLRLSEGRTDWDWPRRIALALAEQRLDAEGHARLLALQQALDESAAQPALRAALADRTEFVWTALRGPLCCTRDALDDVRQALRCLREETRGGGIADPLRLERRLEALFAAPRGSGAINQVQLMTVHKAKGLEFDHVLLAGIHRKPRNPDKPPLHLLPVTSESADALLILPRPDAAWDEKTHPAHRTFDFIHALHAESQRNEALRLLYVAITRARRSATLSLCVKPGTAREALRFEPNSFAALLEPVIRDEVVRLLPSAVAAPAADTAQKDPPRAPRLPLEVVLPSDAGLYRPAESRTERPSEAVLNAQDESAEARRDEGDVYAQLVGTLYHEAMQRVSEEGLAAWADAGASRRTSMAAGLRRRGMPEPRVEAAVERVLTLLARTLGSAQGRWIVEPKPWARSEYPLAGLREGRWVSAVIDRCFEDSDGSLWVIDYKTRAQALEPAQHADYVFTATEKYRGQITQYRGLLAALHPEKRVRGALYFADMGQLVELN